MRLYKGKLHPLIKGVDLNSGNSVTTKFIADRVDGNTLCTTSGRYVVLEGSANQKAVMAEGWPKRIAKLFLHKFPRTWKHLLNTVSEHLLSARKSSSRSRSSDGGTRTRGSTESTSVSSPPPHSRRSFSSPVLQRSRKATHNPQQRIVSPLKPTSVFSRTHLSSPSKSATSVFQTHVSPPPPPKPTHVFSQAHLLPPSHPVKKRARVLSSEDSDAVAAADEDGGAWTVSEDERIDRAMSEIPPHKSHYWRRVAKCVRSRSPTACQLHHQDTSRYRIRAPKAKKTKATVAATTTTSKEQKPLGPVLTAAPGTLKRKEQLRQILQQESENYKDDYFDARKPKKVKVNRRLSLADSDSNNDDLHAIPDSGEERSNNSEDDDDAIDADKYTTSHFLTRPTQAVVTDRYIRKVQSGTSGRRLTKNVNFVKKEEAKKPAEDVMRAADLVKVLAKDDPPEPLYDSCSSDDLYFSDN
ncbi:transmembrane protein 131-like [Sycon ciliatum]|uniref:transmembrane protein 131-like n=1 Tax=Sycon ciliatum TaxID=27933 RepID=UPI0031F682B0